VEASAKVEAVAKVEALAKVEAMAEEDVNRFADPAGSARQFWNP
jgi:hypothetical protein